MVEREAAPRREGYMMDFFGTGWDVAERMDLTDALRAVRYPIERGQFIGPDGKPYCSFPVERMRRALSNRYVYFAARISNASCWNARAMPACRCNSIARSQRWKIAARRSTSDLPTAHAMSSLSLSARTVSTPMCAIWCSGRRASWHFLGYYVAAFHFDSRNYPIGHALNLYEEIDRTAWLYPLDDTRADATYMFRHAEMAYVPHASASHFCASNMAVLAGSRARCCAISI